MEADDFIGKILTPHEKLGSGGFADVIRCTDAEGNEYAVKKCKLTNNGIPHPLEISVMTTIEHPNINRALWVHCGRKYIYIVQDLARCDLGKIVRSDKGRERFTPVTLKKWLCSIVSAVACFHVQGISHSDIKASNILVYRDDTIRLSDFSLVAKLSKGKNGEWKKLTHRVGTVSHRPLENHLGKGWDLSLDIWSLGVTFHEIIYGELPFPYQGKIAKDKKDHLTDRAVNCLLDYGENGPVKQGFQYPPNKFQFLKYKVPEGYKSDPYGLNSLLSKMLSLDPTKRPTIFEIINHPYFSGINVSNYHLNSTPYTKLSPSRVNDINGLCKLMNVDEEVRDLTIHLYGRTEGMNKDKEKDLRMRGCLLIASKILRRYPPSGMIVSINGVSQPHPKIKAIEKKICYSLQYRLHILKID